MRTLPTEIRFTGEGWKNNPRLLLQVQRTGQVAIYAVYQAKKVEHHSDILQNVKPEAYEVIKIKQVPCREIFGTQVEAHEVYPTAKDFGPYGLYVMDLDRAKEVFGEWVKDDKQDVEG